MVWRLDRVTDRWIGHDFPGVVGSGFGRFVLDELELGGLAATLIDDPEQAWWEIHAEQIAREISEQDGT